MFVDFSQPGHLPHRDSGRDRPDELPGDAALLIWSMRRLVVAWPRCHAVQAALHRRFGSEALGVEHLLRCWLAGLASHARRPLLLAQPGSASILADEGAMLFVLRQANEPEIAGAALATLCGCEAARGLLPLAVALQRLSRLG